VATFETTIPFPLAQGGTPLTITSEEISQYAELVSLISQLEQQQKALRGELLDLHKAGAEQETASPYLLAFVDQQRRTVDWKIQALTLAEKLYGIEKAANWKVEVEQSAPVLEITQIRVKPNPSFAARLPKPAASVRATSTLGAKGEEVRFGD
jgi:hypothetical protein